MNKKPEIVRVYLPPDANTLLSVARPLPALPRLRQRRSSPGSSPRSTGCPMDEAIPHCTRGIGIWEWASTDDGAEPDVVLACAGDVPTLETLAAVDLLRRHFPDLRVRVVNVVDLMRLQPDSEHPHGLPDAEFDALFTTDRPVIFAFHGYPYLIHRLTYRRHGHAQPPRARLQGGGHHDDAVRHGHAQRPRPVPPGHGRHRPGSAARRPGRRRTPADGRRSGCAPAPTPASTARTSPRSPAGPGPTPTPRLRTPCGSSWSTPGRAASSSTCSTTTTHSSRRPADLDELGDLPDRTPSATGSSTAARSSPSRSASTTTSRPGSAR